jgi:single-strand DNA-binding protein
MASYNRIVLVGNLTRDPEYKQLASGQGVCKLGIATNRQFKNRQSGQMVQEVCYIDIDVWGAQAESCRQYLQKGRGVLIEGRLKFDSWEDPNGNSRSKHSVVADRVVFLGSNAPADDAVMSGATRSEDADFEPVVAQNEAEQELLDQIEQIKNKKKAKPAPAVEAAGKQAKQGTAGSEISFKDQPPFEDDLPF